MRDHIIMLGTNHDRAPLSVRERLAAPREALPEILAQSVPGINELAILSTCNRTEFYAVVPGGHCPALALQRHVSIVSGIPEAELEPVTYLHIDRQAVHHLFRVASGLDSMVLGEPHILGQLRTAFEAAARADAAGPILRRLGTDALGVGKRVRTLTGLARNRSTIPHVACDLAARSLPAMEKVTAVIVGAGEMGALSAQVLRGAGVGRLIVVNRGEARGRALAERVGGCFHRLDDLTTLLTEADLVIIAAGGDGPLVTPEMVAVGKRSARPFVVIDLGMPRLVDPDCGDVPGVRLLDIDDLAPGAEERRNDAAREVAQAELLIDVARDSFMTWWAQRGSAPTIGALRRQAEHIRAAELDRALRKLRHLSDRDRNVVAALSVGIVNKLLHEPVTRLRCDVDGELGAAARGLFGIDGECVELEARSGSTPGSAEDELRELSAV